VQDFATRLKALRVSRGWTRYRLGKQSGLTPEGVANLEEPGSDPKLSTLHKLAAAFGIDVAELLAGVGAKGTKRRTKRRARKKRPGKV
jgi:transcriptional regulator with XRE-family HTH domain